jgi:hypothetical protein
MLLTGRQDTMKRGLAAAVAMTRHYNTFWARNLQANQPLGIVWLTARILATIIDGRQKGSRL